MLQQLNKTAVFLMGPTAVGKTDLAMALYDALSVDLISVDSSQVYRGMDIGTAKPTTEELRQAPHRLINIRDPSEPYSAADFIDDAKREMTGIWRHQRVPLLVGGTIFYFYSLEHGLAKLPAADPDIRQQLLQEAEVHGWPALHARLARFDPESAARIHPNDSQRIQRALEIMEISGQPATVLNRQEASQGLPSTPVKLALLPADRGELRERIARRFLAMLKNGLIDEVEGLYRRNDLDSRLPAMRMVGYRQIWQYLDGKLDYNQMVEKGIHATRQLAKRQMTWLRSYPDVQKFDCQDSALLPKTLNFLQRKMSQLGVY